MIREADIRRVQEWMGKEDAELVARAFATANDSFDGSPV
jgi:hypothetical protein